MKGTERDYLAIEAKKRTVKIEKCTRQYINYCLKQENPTEREQRAINTFTRIYNQLKKR